MSASEALPLLVAAIGAFAVPLLSGRLGVPAAVGEILFGMAVGPAVLGWLEMTPFVRFLAELGFALLMFLAGLELNFGQIEADGPRAVLRAAAVAAGINGTALVLVVLFGLPLYLFVAVGAVSVGILLVALNETGRGKTPAGQALILAGSVGEFATIVLLTGFAFYSRYGLGPRLFLEMSKLAVVLVAAYLILVVLRTLIWWYPHRFGRVVATHDPSEIGVRAGMALMLAFVALALILGVKAILGAFVAGALFASVFRDKAVLESKLSSVGFGFFVPIFFISVGARFDPRAFLDGAVLASLAALAGLSLLAKGVGAVPLGWPPFTPRDGVGGALLLASPLTLLVVIAQIGQENGLLDETYAGALVLLAMVSSICFPFAYRWLYSRQDAA